MPGARLRRMRQTDLRRVSTAMDGHGPNIQPQRDLHVVDYEIRFLAEDGKVSLTVSEFHNNDESAIQSARKSARGANSRSGGGLNAFMVLVSPRGG